MRRFICLPNSSLTRITANIGTNSCHSGRNFGLQQPDNSLSQTTSWVSFWGVRAPNHVRNHQPEKDNKIVPQPEIFIDQKLINGSKLGQESEEQLTYVLECQPFQISLLPSANKSISKRLHTKVMVWLLPNPVRVCERMRRYLEGKFWTFLYSWFYLTNEKRTR